MAFSPASCKGTLVLLARMHYNIISRKEKGMIRFLTAQRIFLSIFHQSMELFWKNEIMIMSMLYSVYSQNRRSVNLSMHIKVRAVVCSRRNIHGSVRSCGKKYSGARVFV